MRRHDLTQKGNFGDLWHLRHWLQFLQSRTWIHDNLCYLTIKSDSVLEWQWTAFAILAMILHILKTAFDHPTPHLDNMYVQNVWLLFCLQIVRIVHLCWGLKQASTTEEPPVWRDQERNAEIGRMLIAWGMLEITTTAEIQTHSGKASAATQLMVAANFVQFLHAMLMFGPFRTKLNVY